MGKNNSELEFDLFTAEVRALASNAVLIKGKDEAVLVDNCLIQSDAQKLVEMIRSSGRELTSVLITHAHPDHYFGLGAIRKAFPSARIYARREVIDGMREFRAKVVHWQEMYRGELPEELPLPEPLTGDTLQLEGHDITFIDLFMVETVHATAFYLPAQKAFIAGDLVYAQAQHYMSDVNNPDTWMEALDKVRKLGPIEKLFPGHGPVGGAELLDASIQWMRDYKEVAKPGVRFVDIAKAMMQRYPKHELAILLWVTRGPGFGLCGAAEAGVPAGLI
ncbi:MAG TPA: MBL fold metallo-hydrolase [Candidatus Acidoferrales bacterium]|nr:MBL fold metallo-hydrolase [Candidatus Acidoferrales bacterium]